MGNVIKLDSAKPNKNMAGQFLDALDIRGEHTFQTFDDSLERRKKRGKKPDPYARTFHGTLDDHWAALSALNKKGAGIYVTVNETDLQGRKLGNMIGVRAVFIDYDAHGDDPIEEVLAFDPPPTMVVGTSPEKWHAYWVCEEMPLTVFKQFQETLAELFGTDPQVSDISRVMRLPGTLHCKSSTPALVTLTYFNEDAIYGYDHLKKAFDFKPAKKEAKKSIARQFEAPYEDVKALIDHMIELDPGHVDQSYSTWLHIGMALHNWDDGDDGLGLWKYISEATSGDYDEEECETKWETFGRDDDTRTLATYSSDFDFVVGGHQVDSPENDFADVPKTVKKPHNANWLDQLTVTDQMIDDIQEQTPVFKNFIYEKHIVTIIGQPGSGKTSVLLNICGKMCENGYRVIYLHGDAVPDGLHIGHGVAKATDGMMMYCAPNMIQGMTMTEVRKFMVADVKAGVSLDKRVYVIDTLKQMADVLKKEDAKAFFALCRKLTTLGATVVLLGHTNKYGDADGFPIYEGTGDLLSDSDDVFYLIPTMSKHTDEDGENEYHYSSLYWQHKVRCPTEAMTWKIYRGGVAWPSAVFVDTLTMNRNKDLTAEPTNEDTEDNNIVMKVLKDAGSENPLTLTQLMDACVKKYNMPRRKARAAIHGGEGQYWEVIKSKGLDRTKRYRIHPLLTMKSGKLLKVENIDD